MKRTSVLLISLIFTAVLAVLPVFAADGNYGPSDSSDFIEGDTVDEHKKTDGLLEGDLVDAVPTKPIPTKVVELPTEIPTEVEMIEPDPEPTRAPAPTPKPKPTKVTPKPTPRPTARPTPRPTPVPYVKPAVTFPELSVTKADISEIVMKRSLENYFGLLTTERKFTLNLVLENKGKTSSYYTVATLKSGDTSILMSEPEKKLATVLPGSKLDLVYNLVVLGSYDGDLKLPLTLKITANGMEKELPIEVYIDEAVPYLLYAGAGLLILLILLMIIIMLRGRRGGGQAKKGKDYDFDV